MSIEHRMHSPLPFPLSTTGHVQDMINQHSSTTICTWAFLVGMSAICYFHLRYNDTRIRWPYSWPMFRPATWMADSYSEHAPRDLSQMPNFILSISYASRHG